MGVFKILFTLIFGLAGSLLLFIGFREGAKPYKLLKYGIETQGVVTELYKRPMRGNEKSSGSFAPVVQFWTEKGESVTYYSTTFTNFNEFQIGQQVKIWYSADDLKLATLEGKDNWILAVAFGIFGSAICLIFYPMFFKQIFSFIKGQF